jgi:hypothetical protein
MVKRRDYSKELAEAARSVFFDDITDPEDRTLRQRDAFERIQYLLSALVRDG